MIRHLVKLIWNKKRSHSLLIVEIWASFIVLFGLVSLIVYNVSNYVEPLGFSYERVWSISLDNNQDTTAIAEKTKRIFQRLKSYPAIESVSRMSINVPFSTYYNGNGIEYNKKNVQVAFYITDAHFAETLNVTLLAGSWYKQGDWVGKYRPVIINQQTKTELFGTENAIGKVIPTANKEFWRVAGVIGNFKAKGEFMANKPAVFVQLDESSLWDKTMLIRVKPGTDAIFEAKLIRDIALMAKGWSVEVNYLSEGRKSQYNYTLVPVIIFLIISGFLLINVALGLFGVLNVSITRRRGEIGLRRALGATEGAIARQIVGEMWVLATFALVLGLLLAIQFPLLNVFDLAANIYLTAMAVAAVVIYLLVTLCALYPGLQAAKLQPAVALHEE